MKHDKKPLIIFSVRLPEYQVEFLKKEADSTLTNKNQVIRKIIAQYIGKNTPKNATKEGGDVQ